MKKTSKLILFLLAGMVAFTVSAATVSDYPTPVHRPILEEYTGGWCGWCIRGIVGMELLNRNLGNDFIGVAYHNGDAMQIMGSNQYPNRISGYPNAYIDRYANADPYYGFGSTSAGILSDMQQMAAIEAIAGIDVTAEWADEDRTVIKVHVSSYFTVDDNEGSYAIEVMLVADGLYGTGSDWEQQNFYAGNQNYAKDPYLARWVKQPAVISGFRFKEVLIGTSGVIAGSLPEEIVAYNTNNFDYTFTLSQLPKPSLVQNKDKLHVVAIVVNRTTKRAINANKTLSISDYVPVPVIPGDVDDDGDVTIADVTTLIDYILNSEIATINMANADVDEDGEISIADVTSLIDLILLGH